MRSTLLPRRKEHEEQRKFYTKEELKTLLDSFKNFGNTKQYTFLDW